MLDIKWIRENPQALVDALVKRSWSSKTPQSMVDDLIARDEARRAHVATSGGPGTPQRRLEGDRQGDGATRTRRLPRG